MKIHIIKSLIAALALALVTNLHAQTPAAPAAPAAPVVRDPYAAGKAAAPAPAPVPQAQTESTETVSISVAYEAFSLPIVKAGELQRMGMSDAELYKELITTGKLERLLVLRTKSGQRAVLENVTGYRYPTEFAPPQIPGDFVQNSGTPNKPMPSVPLPIAPVAIEKIDLGDLFEAEPTLSADAKSVDMQFQVSHTALTGRDKWGQGLAEVEQPQVESQKMNTNISLAIGSPFLIGTLNPVFGNGTTKRAEQNVWFCFITAAGVPASSAAAKKSAH